MIKTEEHKQKQDHKKKKKQGLFLSNFHEESPRHERTEREAQGKEEIVILSVHACVSVSLVFTLP